MKFEKRICSNARSHTVLMRAFLFGAFMAVCLWPAFASAQGAAPAADWSKWNFLLGNWEGEGGGNNPGQGTGGFKFYLDLDKRVLVRTNYANYPATKDQPAYSHTDLMVIHQEPDKSAKATYWDNEGHVINYTATVSSDTTSWIFVSDTSSVAPRFRLIYSKTGEKSVSIKFEIAPQGTTDNFRTYLEATASKK